jgi:hypothetical protein
VNAPAHRFINLAQSWPMVACEEKFESRFE